jgi:hypothetical protein
MHRFLHRTWKPTLAFVTLSWIVAGVALGNVFVVAVPALLLTPVVWWLLVARKDHPDPRHGAIAGAILALAAQAVPLVFAFVWLAQIHPSGASDWLRSLHARIAGAQIVGAMAGIALGSVIGSLLARGRLPRI